MQLLQMIPKLALEGFFKKGKFRRGPIIEAMFKREEGHGINRIFANVITPHQSASVLPLVFLVIT